MTRENMQPETRGVLVFELMHEMVEKPWEKLADMESSGFRSMFKSYNLYNLELAYRVIDRC